LYPFTGLSISGDLIPAAGFQCSQSVLVASDGFSTPPFEFAYGVYAIQHSPALHADVTRMKSGCVDSPVLS